MIANVDGTEFKARDDFFHALRHKAARLPSHGLTVTLLDARPWAKPAAPSLVETLRAQKLGEEVVHHVIVGANYADIYFRMRTHSAQRRNAREWVTALTPGERSRIAAAIRASARLPGVADVLDPAKASAVAAAVVLAGAIHDTGPVGECLAAAIEWGCPVELDAELGPEGRRRMFIAA